MVSHSRTAHPCLFSPLASSIILCKKPPFSFGDAVLPVPTPHWPLAAGCLSGGEDPEDDVGKHPTGTTFAPASAGKGQWAKPEPHPPSWWLP